MALAFVKLISKLAQEEIREMSWNHIKAQFNSLKKDLKNLHIPYQPVKLNNPEIQPPNIRECLLDLAYELYCWLVRKK